MLKRIYILLVFVGISAIGIAQQNPLFNQYYFNPLGINPAYAGSRDALSVAFIGRNQWLGIQDAPTTQTFSIHTPIRSKSMAVGFQITNDLVGPTNTTAAYFNYAYKLKLFTGKLAFGLRAGLINYKYNFSKITYKDSNDPLNYGGVQTTLVPNFDFGMYFNTKRLYLGFEASHLNSPKINFTDTTGTNSTYNRLYEHFNIVGGYAFQLKKSLVYKPSFLARTTFEESNAVIVDITNSFLYNDFLWLGASYRTSNTLILTAEIVLKNSLRIGYAFDYNLNRTNVLGVGSHEIFLGLDLSKNNFKMISPRYF